MVENNEESFSYNGFGYAIRTFYIVVSNLRVVRSWSAVLLPGWDDGDEFSTMIIGHATCDPDKVCVIGSPNRTNNFNLTMRAKTNEQVKSHWEWEKAERGWEKAEDVSVEGRVRKIIREQLDINPPTAVLFHVEKDKEIGFDEHWSIECAVLPSVLPQLVDDTISRRAAELRIGISWVGGLIQDKYAPPSVPTTWGLMARDNSGGSEALHGHITNVSWTLTQTV